MTDLQFKYFSILTNKFIPFFLGSLLQNNKEKWIHKKCQQIYIFNALQKEIYATLSMIVVILQFCIF